MKETFSKFLLSVSLVIAISGCYNNARTNQEASAQKESVRDTAKENYVKFLDEAASSPITEYDLYDGFRFGMSKKQFNARYSKYKKIEKKYAQIKINNQVYTASVEDKYLDDKMYKLEFNILSVGNSDYKAPSSSDVNSIVNYFSSQYGDYKHIFISEPLTTEPTHLWKKNNKIVTVSTLYAGIGINSISITFENYPIIRGISKKMSAAQMKRIREKAEAKKNNEGDPVIGMYKCKRTNDKYLFNSDGTGYLFTGGTQTEFKWSRKDDIVTLVYEAFGKEYLLFDKKKKTLKEDSESYGILVFEKI